MQSFFKILTGIGILALLAGCLTVSQYKFTLDTGTGEVRREYVDLTSKQGANEKDYSVEKDWAALKQMLEDKKPEYDPDVVEDVSRELFEENRVLCARKIQKVKCPKCFPSRAALLAFLHEKEWRFEPANDEIIAILPPGRKIISTNGQRVTTDKNSLIVWPVATNRFEYVVSEQWSGGESLLRFYQQEKAKPK